jgi:hypothetical protein
LGSVQGPIAWAGSSQSSAKASPANQVPTLNFQELAPVYYSGTQVAISAGDTLIAEETRLGVITLHDATSLAWHCVSGGGQLLHLNCPELKMLWMRLCGDV